MQILNKVDDFLNSITMYRLLLYYLIFLLIIAFIFSFFHLLPFGPINLLFSTFFLVAVCLLINKIFESVMNVQTNLESLFLTALILASIITPIAKFDFKDISFLFWTASLAMASKYILAINKKHIFNPAAIAVVITGIVLGGYASWWIGTLVMLPFTLLGVLIVRKIRRFDLVFYFFIASLASILFFSAAKGDFNIMAILKRTFVDTPIIFFAFVMLTEPLTTPPTKALQALYGALTGVLFAPQFHLGNFFTTPEIALVIGNIFSFAVSPKEKLILKLKEINKLTPNIYDFIFEIPHPLNFTAGQYMGWTLRHKSPDARGNRRYFTLSSSPTENEARIGIKFEQDRGSSFKTKMLSLKKGDSIAATELAGDFILPKDKNKKLVFIAGGIGITPFRSIIKYLLDINEKKDIILIYNEESASKMIYQDVFNNAQKKLGLKVIYFETSKNGRMTADTIQKHIPDYKDRLFYISGSRGMVTGFEKTLDNLNLPKNQIKIDYFPGF